MSSLICCIGSAALPFFSDFGKVPSLMDSQWDVRLLGGNWQIWVSGLRRPAPACFTHAHGLEHFSGFTAWTVCQIINMLLLCIVLDNQQHDHSHTRTHPLSCSKGTGWRSMESAATLEHCSTSQWMRPVQNTLGLVSQRERHSIMKYFGIRDLRTSNHNDKQQFTRQCKPIELFYYVRCHFSVGFINKKENRKILYLFVY